MDTTTHRLDSTTSRNGSNPKTAATATTNTHKANAVTTSNTKDNTELAKRGKAKGRGAKEAAARIAEQPPCDGDKTEE